jgi:1,4-alpha-glucan branching enzyme
MLRKISSFLTTLVHIFQKMDKRYYHKDPLLDSYRGIIDSRIAACSERETVLTGNTSLSDFANGHHWYGLHTCKKGWVIREHAPNAISVYLIGTFTKWKKDEQFRFTEEKNGDWVLEVNKELLKHGDLYKLFVTWKGGSGERIPAYATRVVQDDVTKIFTTQIWQPKSAYRFKHPSPPQPESLLIYEAHTGMATEEEKTGSYREFTSDVLPRVCSLGYNTVQLMAVQEHPFYGSFGYHVSSLFAPSSRFGTPDDLKELIDTAHSLGLRVIMDLVHSHAVKNTNEGLGLQDGNPGLYFHAGQRRNHVAWDSLCFDYGSTTVLHFLLSNCKYWLEEFRFDGFRFDGVTSMIYYDHGLGKNFTSYQQYFDGNQDGDAITYLTLANKLIHQINPNAVTVAEEMSGMPGIATPVNTGGVGFDYRLAMGVPDIWIKMVKEIPDEKWDLGYLIHELTQHRPEEKVVSYCESHDQALVGDKTLIFRLADAEMYTSMSINTPSLIIDRAVALHKMIRLFTFSTAAGGYLNFMGNEFGHPEWIDFPREGNNWSYKYARRQWSLSENNLLRYYQLNNFDSAMLKTGKEAGIPGSETVKTITVNNPDKVIAYSRGELLFVMNFNPVKSFTAYGIPVKGKFNIVLSTDDISFGGQDRIDTKITYMSEPLTGKYSIMTEQQLLLYLPARTAIVLKQIPTAQISEL